MTMRLLAAVAVLVLGGGPPLPVVRRVERRRRRRTRLPAQRLRRCRDRGAAGRVAALAAAAAGGRLRALDADGLRHRRHRGPVRRPRALDRAGRCGRRPRPRSWRCVAGAAAAARRATRCAHVSRRSTTTPVRACAPPLTRCRRGRRTSPPRGASWCRPPSASCRPARCRPSRGPHEEACSRRPSGSSYSTVLRVVGAGELACRVPHATCSRPRVAGHRHAHPPGSSGAPRRRPARSLGADGGVGGVPVADLGQRPTGTPTAATATAAAASPAAQSAVRRRRRAPRAPARAAAWRAAAGRPPGARARDASTRPSRPGRPASSPTARVQSSQPGRCRSNSRRSAGDEGAEHVGGVVVGERAAHAVTPISSSASLSARSA